jgi:hypothetical protein
MLPMALGFLSNRPYRFRAASQSANFILQPAKSGKTAFLAGTLQGGPSLPACL